VASSLTMALIQLTPMLIWQFLRRGCTSQEGPKRRVRQAPSRSV
jgi:hypothetical protein